MQQIPIGVSTLLGSRLAYGCWRLAGTWTPGEITPAREADGRRAVLAAYEAGYTLFDHADIYCRGEAERIFGTVLKEVPGMRDRIVIATKGGIRVANDPPGAPGRYDFSAEHIIRACEGSLRRLGVETIDLYQLHRPDFLADPAEVAQAFTQLHQAGKVRYFGLSNTRPSLLAALQAACPLRFIVHQVEISLAKLDTFTDGTLDQCLTAGLTPLAWSPLAKGLLGDGNNQNFPLRNVNSQVESIVGVLDELAHAHGATRTTVALAWLLRHPSRIIPIVGSTTPARIHEAVRALEINLSREEWYRLLIAARGEPLP